MDRGGFSETEPMYALIKVDCARSEVAAAFAKILR
jgi:hypothetical protein